MSLFQLHRLGQFRIFDPVKAGTKPDAKAEPKPKPENEGKPQPEVNAKTPTDLTPQIVKRVHQRYEDLGRQDVQAVEALEQAKREQGKDQPEK
jgi:hypothetical protein